jgi:hypothetical protein
MRVFAIALLILAVLIPTSVRAQIQPAHGFDQTAMDATFAVYGEYPDAKTHKAVERFICSGFIFQADATGYLIMSAGHCVDKDPIDSTYSVAEQIGAPTMHVECVFARLVPASKDYGDVAVFHLATTKKYPVLELGDESSEHIGSATINPNFALGLGKQLAHGEIASAMMTRLEECPLCEGQFMLHEFAGSGASGSAIISAETHKVVGILVGQIQPVGYAIEPISTANLARQENSLFFEMHRVPPPDKKVRTGLFGPPNEDE